MISGFVISLMLEREWRASGRIRLATFYLRRFRRLTPALALLVTFTVCASVLVLSPFGPQQAASSTAMGAMLLVANRVIAVSTGGYFDLPAERNPLLHTWSLSVEEQIYLVFPALLAALWLFRRRSMESATLGRRFPLKNLDIAAVGLGTVLSFALAVAGSTRYTEHPSWLVHFYSPLTRAWEFGSGVLLALLVPRFASPSRIHATITGLLGGSAIAVAVLVLDGATPFPGLWTLLPVVGTALLLFAGSGAPNIATRVLSLHSLVLMGDWSYSVYLWHWPLVVFARQIWPGRQGPPLIAACLAFVPAVASYRWIESPLRHGDPLSRGRTAGLVAMVMVPPVLLAAGLSVFASRVLAPELESGKGHVVHPGEIGHLAFHSYLRERFLPCADPEMRALALRWEGIERCQQSGSGLEMDLAVIGDSHAEQLFPGLAESLHGAKVAYYVDVVPVGDPRFLRIVEHVGAVRSIRAVVLAFYWRSKGVDREGLARAIRELSRKGKRVFVATDIPDFPFDPFECKYRWSPFLRTRCSIATRDFEQAGAEVDRALARTVSESRSAELLDLAKYLCGSGSCDMTYGGRILYRDQNHLNVEGSRYLARQVVRDHPGLRSAVSGP